MLNDRCVGIIKKLTKSNKSYTITELSSIFNVSERTIRYDLNKINLWLKDNGLKSLIKGTKKNIIFPKENINNHKFKQLFNEFNTYQYILKPKERIVIILLELFYSKDFITIEYLSDQLCVSRGTVVSDLKFVKDWLVCNELYLNSVKSHGLKIEGKEKDIRKAILNLNESSNSNFIKVKDFKKNVNYDFMQNNQIKKLFGDINTDYIEDAIKSVEKDLDIVFSDIGYIGLVFHLAITIRRIKLGYVMKESIGCSKNYPRKEIRVVKNIIKKIEKNFNISVPKSEIEYITTHILGSKLFNSSNYISKEWLMIQILTTTLINELNKWSNINFMEDIQLIESLAAHLGPTIFRLKKGLYLKNPILKDIKNEFKETFEIVKHCCETNEDLSIINIEEEIAYIVLHIEAAIERYIKYSENKLTVVVVCGSGVGTSNLITSKLEKEFNNIKIKEVTTVRNLTDNFNSEDVDLVVSTIDLKHIDIPFIKVSVFINLDDIEAIHKFIIRNKKNININKRKIWNDNSNFILPKIKNKRRIGIMLKDLIKKENIQIGIKASDWKEAIRISGNVLVNQKLVKKEYIDAIIRNTEELGPYIVIAPGVAMPHARPENGVNSICLSLSVLKKPINFGNKKNDPVKLVIILGAIDNESHLRALSDLMSLLNNAEYVEKVINAKTVNEIINTINLVSK